MKPVTLCATQHSAVYVCARCDARDVVTTRHAALTAAAGHYDVAHPDQAKAADQLRRRARELRATRRS